MAALYALVHINGHVVAQVVKTKLVVGTVGDVSLVHRLTILRCNRMDDQTGRQTEVTVYLAHPLGVTLCQIVVDRDDVHTLAGQRIEVCRKGCHQGLTFTGLHLRDTALVQHDAADDLYAVVTHTQYAVGCLAHGCECFGQQLVQVFAVLIALLELRGLAAQLLVCQLTVLVLERHDLVRDRIDLLQLMARVGTENLFK